VEVNSEGQLVVARVLAGGSIEKQGLVRPGDIILEVSNFIFITFQFILYT
jgi:C-terminal processing protease CtpA/Prc